MKIRLSAQGMSLNVEVQDDKAMAVYRGLAEKLLIHAGETGTAYNPKVVVVKPGGIKAPEVTEMIREALEAELQQGKESLPEPVPPEQDDDEDLPEEPAGENPPPRTESDGVAEKSSGGKERATGGSLGTGTDGKKKKPVDTGKMLALRRAGWSMKKIGDELGISESSVFNYLKKLE